MPDSVRVGGCEYFPDGSRIQWARCEACQFGQHPGGFHGWAGPEDVAHAKATGQDDPSQLPCGCTCYGGVTDLRDWEPLGTVDDGLNSPCPICGSEAACGYDSEGRPLIHALSGDDDE